MAITISSGQSAFQPTARIIAETKLLEKPAKNVIVGSKTFSDIQYTAVLVKGMPLSSKKFTSSNSDVLFLLPPEYPRPPP